jgi:hypothetical protein
MFKKTRFATPIQAIRLARARQGVEFRPVKIGIPDKVPVTFFAHRRLRQEVG